MHILLVEDMDSDAELIRLELLDEWPTMRLEWAKGRQALLEALACPPPDLVLCDSRLPGLNGDEAQALVERAWPSVPFVFCTGAADDPALKPALVRSAAVIDKNRLQTLVPAIKRVMAARHPG